MSIMNELLSQISIAYGGSGGSETRNELLTEIAVALGSTPRNESNRNMLLEDILQAI